MRPHKKNCVDARREILRAAEKCFGGKGYAGTSVQDIIAETSFSKPVIYYYFGNKEGLFLSLLEEASRESLGVMKKSASAGGSARDRLVAVALGLFGFLQRRRALVRLAFSAAFAGPGEVPESEEVLRIRQQHLDLVHDLVRAGRRSGELGRIPDSLSMTHGIYGAICYHIMNNLTIGTARLDRETAETVVDLFFRGAGAREHEPRAAERPSMEAAAC